MDGQEKKVFLVKTLAFLSLIRWYNLLLIVLAQVFAALFIIHFDAPKLPILLDFRFFITILSSDLIIAGGYLINAFYDFEKDLVNERKDLIINKVISKNFTLKAYLFLSFAGIVLGLSGGFRVVIFNIIFAFLLWLYSHKFKKMLFMGDLMASLLTVSSFLVVSIYFYSLPSLIIIYALFIFIVELTRELVKDLEGIKGDLIMNYSSIPLKYGIKNTKILISALFVLLPLPFWIFYEAMGLHPLNYFFIPALILAGICWILLIKSKNQRDYKRVHLLIKLLIVCGILALPILSL